MVSYYQQLVESALPTCTARRTCNWYDCVNQYLNNRYGVDTEQHILTVQCLQRNLHVPQRSLRDLSQRQHVLR